MYSISRINKYKYFFSSPRLSPGMVSALGISLAAVFKEVILGATGRMGDKDKTTLMTIKGLIYMSVKVNYQQQFVFTFSWQYNYTSIIA